MNLIPLDAARVGVIVTRNNDEAIRIPTSGNAQLKGMAHAKNHRHPGAGRDPVVAVNGFVPWIPAFAGMTRRYNWLFFGLTKCHCN